MKEEITTLLVDIGGVLLTNGWDRLSRRLACDEFGLDYEEVNERHHLVFGAYEEGRISLEDYLDRVIFYEPRKFSLADFREFMFGQSRAYPDMIDLVEALKSRYHLKVVAVSNEGRELTDHRVQHFDMKRFVDFFVISSFVQIRKPDPRIFRLALDLSQVEPNNVVYLEDRQMFVEVASNLGIHGIHHAGYESTRAALAEMGLALDEVTPRNAPAMVEESDTVDLPASEQRRAA